MKKFYFLILIGIFIISAGIAFYFSQRFFNSYEIISEPNLEPNSIKIEEPLISFLFVGDIMLDRKVEKLMRENSFFYPFEKITEFLNKSDGAFGNLEGPISKNPNNYSLTAMEFAFDARVVDSLASSNFKVLSLANNHTLNMGQVGLAETKELLGKAEIDWIGDPWGCSNKISVNEGLVFVAFNKTFSGCGDEKIIEIIESVKDSGPEKFLIVSIHWGDEYKPKSSKTQQNLAHKIIDAGADLIVGHHPHVVQEIEKYNDKLIFYSLGNFIFDQYFSKETQEGLIVELEIYPLTKDFGGRVVYKLHPVKSELSQPALMDQKEAETFLEKLGSESIIEIEKEKRVCFNENCFYVELAETSEEKSRGLMYRESLAENRGMLFIFNQEGPYSFWMKNTLIPLDIIWLNQGKEVVFIKKSAQPCPDEECPSIKPDREAKYVLEINGGLSDKINLKIGDKFIFND